MDFPFCAFNAEIAEEDLQAQFRNRLSTNPTDEPITSGLPVIWGQSPNVGNGGISCLPTESVRGLTETN
jgi:hypothetical protein